MKSKVLVDLYIYADDVEPDEITNAVGLKPTHTHRKGDLLHNTGARAEQTVWCFATPWVETVDTKGMLRRFVDIVRPNSDRINDAQKRWDLSIQFGLAVETYGRDFPKMRFEPDIVQTIAELKALIHIDAYYFAE